MRKAILVGVVGCLLGSGTLVSAAEVKIGYINLQRIKETNEWKRLEDAFQAEVGKSQREVGLRRQELEAAALQYQRQKPMLSEDAQRAREMALKKQRLEFQLWTQDRQQILERERDKISQQLWSRVKEVVEKIAKKKRLGLVVDYEPNPTDVTVNFEKGFIYLAPEMDITDEVIKAFNALFEGKM